VWWDFPFRPGHHPPNRHCGPAVVRYPLVRSLTHRRHRQLQASEWRPPRDPSSTNEQQSGLVSAELKHCVERMRSPKSVATSMRNTGEQQQRRNHQLATKRAMRGKWQSRWSTRRRQAWLNIRHRHVLVLGHGRHRHLVRHASEAAKRCTPGCESKTLSQIDSILCNNVSMQGHICTFSLGGS